MRKCIIRLKTTLHLISFPKLITVGFGYIELNIKATENLRHQILRPRANKGFLLRKMNLDVFSYMFSHRLTQVNCLDLAQVMCAF